MPADSRRDGPLPHPVDGNLDRPGPAVNRTRPALKISDRVRNMISTAGAGLIAQILPVLLLIGAVERRALGPVVVPRKGAPLRRRRLAWIVVNILTLAFAFLVELLCIESVATNVRLDVLRGVPVVIAMLALGVVISVTIMDLYVSSLFGIDSYRERQADSERRLLIGSRARRVAKLSKRLQK